MQAGIFSIKRAIEIITASDLSKTRKIELIHTLEYINDSSGVRLAKLYILDSEKTKVKKFVERWRPLNKPQLEKYDRLKRNLKLLSALGINPVIIPFEYGLTELSNPIHELHLKYKATEDEYAIHSSRIQVDEIVYV